MSLRVEQQRIQRAYAVLEDVVHAGCYAEWRTSVLGFGADVQRCGLLQTIAFLYRGRDKKSQDVANKLSAAVRDHLVDRRLLDTTPPGDLLAALRTMDGDCYMLATREVLALSVWLKRATQAHAPAKD